MNKNKFDEFVAKNLPKALKKATFENLGNRSEYVGGSDIGGCLRKSYLDKKVDVEYDLATLIRFQRGHIAEGIVKSMLDGLNPTKQLEVKMRTNGIALKAHIDFSLENKDEIVIIEAKSVNSSVDEPFLSWILQVQYQMFMLRSTTNKNVRAYIVAINLNTGWFKSFEIERNKNLTQIAIDNAETLAKALKENKEPQAKEQLYCLTCPHKATCPLMNKGINEEKALQGDLLEVGKKLIELNAKKKELEKELDEKKTIIEEYMRAFELKKLKVDESFISLSNDTQSTSFDTKALQTKEPELYNELFEKYQKASKRKGYISIK